MLFFTRNIVYFVHCLIHCTRIKWIYFFSLVSYLYSVAYHEEEKNIFKNLTFHDINAIFKFKQQTATTTTTTHRREKKTTTATLRAHTGCVNPKKNPLNVKSTSNNTYNGKPRNSITWTIKRTTQRCTRRCSTLSAALRLFWCVYNVRIACMCYNVYICIYIYMLTFAFFTGRCQTAFTVLRVFDAIEMSFFGCFRTLFFVWTYTILSILISQIAENQPNLNA